MAPEANKQQQRSAVDTLWTRLAFILRGNSKQRAAHTTNWQSKLMCNWAAMHFREPAVSSAGGDHTPAPPSHHIVWFSTCCLQNLLCFTMWTHNKGRSRCCRELRNSEALSWHTVLNEEEEKHTFAPFYCTVASRVLPQYFAGLKWKSALRMFKQMMNVLICVTTAQCYILNLNYASSSSFATWRKKLWKLLFIWTVVLSDYTNGRWCVGCFVVLD